MKSVNVDGFEPATVEKRTRVRFWKGSFRNLYTCADLAKGLITVKGTEVK